MSWENDKIKGTPLFEFLEYDGFPDGLDNKRVCLQCRRSGFDPWIRKTPWRREWQCTPIFLLGEFHEQRSLVGQSMGSQRVSNDWATFTFRTWQVLCKALKHVYYHVRIESPVYVRCRIQHAWGWCTGMTQRDVVGREVGGGFMFGITCTPMVDSCQYMAKPIQYCKVK